MHQSTNQGVNQAENSVTETASAASAENADRSASARFLDWCRLRSQRLSDPETIASTIIVAVIALPTGIIGLAGGIVSGLIVMLIVLAVALAVHMTAVESGHYAMLWTATTMLLVLVVIGVEIIFQDGSPIVYAFGGALALAHNELVRINFARRRNTIVDDRIFSSSAIGVGAASGIGIVATGIAQVFSLGTNRTWAWIIVAFTVLTLVGLAIVIAPVRNATTRDKEKFVPGERIPPQPLAKESLPEP